MPKGARKYAQDEASSRADGGAGLSARQHRRAGLGEHEKPRGSHRMMPSTGVKITTIIS